MLDYRTKFPGNPQADPAAVVKGEHYRITVLTESLLRLEYDAEGRFEDRATQSVINRAFPVPEFKIRETETELKIFTRYLELTYDKKPFSASGLSVRVSGVKFGNSTWYYGDKVPTLGGTARTLDNVNGEIPLEEGVASIFGFAVTDDSTSMALTEDGWVEPRREGTVDLYYWGYGYRYAEAVKDLYRLCGSTPLLPRWALGNWWSRYHKYTEKEYKELVTAFEEEGIPFSVAVVDMDWHLVDVDPRYGTGWTGYTWNRDFFPDPKRFMEWLHEHSMKVTLNVHPADGVRAFEDCYERAAKRMGIDPKSGEPVAFDIADPHFVEVYFEEVHHPLEDEGVDFWWLDWQQGKHSKMPGLDPLWMLNHYHYLDSARRGNRPITFSRYAGIGSHRYPVGFSGDTWITWESLKFQPYFTATASNVGYGWWSHDIGGHMHGSRDDELSTRWYQLGVFSPINRLHSTDNPFNGKEPWKYGHEAEEVMERFLRLRHQLVPYLYTMNRIASREGQPLVRPLYWEEPENFAVYEMKNEYCFGTELLCAPITDPADRETLLAKTPAWLPAGTWYDIFNGRRYAGGRRLNLYRPLSEMPVLARAGAIVSLAGYEYGMENDVSNPETLEVLIFPGAAHTFDLWEDAGDTAEDKDENWAVTRLSQDGNGAFAVSPAAGNLTVLPKTRTWRLRFWVGGEKDALPDVYLDDRDGIETEDGCRIEWDGCWLTVELENIPADTQIRVVLPEAEDQTAQRNLKDVYRILERAQIGYEQKRAVWEAVQALGAKAYPSLLSMGLSAEMLGAVMEVLGAE